MSEVIPQSSEPDARSPIRLLPEVWAAKASEFILRSGSPEEAAADGRPELVYARVYVPTERQVYADFNIRSRLFRCQEIFFVETDEEDRITALVAIDTMRTRSRVLGVTLVVAKPDPDPDVSFPDRLAILFDRMLQSARRFSPKATQLRFSYVYDTTVGAPIGARASSLMIDPPPGFPLYEQARIPNETGQSREAVLIAFKGLTGEAGLAGANAPG